MQVKKFEAPTIQEALDTIKRELGPEAIILSTKKHKRGFGLMSRASVEVTAAVSDRALQKKGFVEKRAPEPVKQQLGRLPAGRQAEFIDKFAAPRGADKFAAPRGADKRGATRAAAGATVSRDVTERFADPRGASKYAAQSAAARAHAQAKDPVAERAAAATPGRPAAAPQVTVRRYIDIEDEGASAFAGALHRAPSGATTAPLVTQGLGVGMTVEEELRQLKRMIEEMKTTQDPGLTGSGAQALLNPALAAAAGSTALATPALHDAFEQLVINGIDKRYALAMIRKVAFDLGTEAARSPDHVLDQLAAEIMTTTEVLSPLSDLSARGAAGEARPGHPLIVALVGPTGVGKTTTVAKIASDALLRRGLKVGLINLDCYKVAAFDQLATYAKILNVPFRSAGSAADYQAAIGDFQGLDVVFVDTTGRSQRDPSSLKELEQLLHALPGVQTQLVLSATTRDNELYDMASRFAVFRPQGLIVSKLDEATIYGSVYNVSQRVKLPLMYFTTGQRVPEDIEEATRERVAALIMDL
jgi:flagellar biosynthesis protein FlhF